MHIHSNQHVYDVCVCAMLNTMYVHVLKHAGTEPLPTGLEAVLTESRIRFYHITM